VRPRAAPRLPPTHLEGLKPMLGLGIGEIVVILAIVVLFFGAKRIPEIARGMGEGIRNFKGGLKEGDPPPKDRLEDGNGESRERDDDPR
jgi:sec-independent protein translocase protein TatA